MKKKKGPKMGKIRSPDKFSKFGLKLDKIWTDLAKIGTDKNLEIGDFSIYHLQHFQGSYLMRKPEVGGNTGKYSTGETYSDSKPVAINSD